MSQQLFSYIQCWKAQESKMLAILEQVEVASGHHADNTEKYLLLMLFKLGLDAAVFYLCSQKSYAYVFTTCSLSVVLADVVLTCSLAGVWFVGADRSLVSLCSLLAHASATYEVIPAPVMLLGLLDYYLHDSYLCNTSTSYKRLRNSGLLSLGWTLALLHSLSHVKAEVRELNYPQLKALVCEVGESVPISLFNWMVFAAVFCTMLPFLPQVPHWVAEADRLSQLREEHKSHGSDLFISTCEKPQQRRPLATLSERPPLLVSLALAFGSFWLPYLAISVACLFFDVGVPAYISVNVLWMECANSLLTGFIFWSKSNKEGPYSQLPNNVCLWNVFWHLSNGTRDQGLPVAVFNPSKVKRTSLFLV